MASGLGRSRGTRKGRKRVHALRPVSLNHFKYDFNCMSLIAGKKSPFPEERNSLIRDCVSGPVWARA